MKGRDIVVIGIQPWDIKIGSNCKNIAIGFAAQNRVLFVNMPLDRKTNFLRSKDEAVRFRKQVLSGSREALAEVLPNFWTLYPRCVLESINSVPDGKVYDWLNFTNAKRFFRTVLDAMHELNFRDVILFNDSSMFLGFYAQEFMQTSLAIYYIRDNLINNPYWRKHGLRLEPALIGKYDVVLANSEYYRDYASRYNRNSYMVGQGCDISAFDENLTDIPEAPGMDSIRRPVVGYIGHLTSRRLDIDLIHYLAVILRDMSFVLIGREDYVFLTSGLHDLDNIFFLGEKEESEIPGYLKAFDVAINPQKVNLATIGNYPRKVDEYLAMGKPVVCMNTLAMQYFKDSVYLADNREQFAAYIKDALSNNTRSLVDMRKEVARSHSWERCNALIEEIIDAQIAKRFK